MPQPPAYTITTDFSQDESNNVSGRSTVKTASVDTEFVNIKSFIDQMRTNIALIQADDGTIKDDAVDLPTLADDVINYITTNGNGWYGADTGTVNAMVVTLSPAPTSLTNGMFVVSDIKLTNTSTAVTLNVNGLGAKDVVLDGAGTLPTVGLLTTGTFYGFQYDSSADKFQTVFSGDSLVQAANAENSATQAETALDNFTDIFLGSKTSDPTVDNDGDALTDGALYFNTTNNVLMVYDLGGTTWQRTTPTSSEQANINTVSGISANVTSVANNEANVNRYADEYTIASSSPSTPSEGDLWFDTTNDVLKVYNSSSASWVAVTSATAGILSVAEDTTPQLGGALDCQSENINNCGTVAGANLQMDFGGLS